MVKVYYKIPDSNNDLQNKVVGMLYENFKLRIQLALAEIEKITEKENGIIIIERTADAAEIRYENFKPETVCIMKYLIAQIKVRQKVRM